MNTKNRTKADWYSDHTYSESFLFGISRREPAYSTLPLDYLTLSFKSRKSH